MIAIQVSGDFNYSDYRSDWRQASQLVNTFVEYIKQLGYRKITRESREVLIVGSRDGGRVRIESGRTTPKGVRP